MAKNENNSHAFIRKMVENIKQTKDAQGPDDPKMNEVSDTFWLEVHFILACFWKWTAFCLHISSKVSFNRIMCGKLYFVYCNYYIGCD